MLLAVKPVTIALLFRLGDPAVDDRFADDFVHNDLAHALSANMEAGTVARWLMHEGEEVKCGDVIAEIETDKAVMEMEAK